MLYKQTLLKRIRKSWYSYAMIAPFFILFFIFTVLPVLSSMVLSFTNFNMLEWPHWVGWMNYKHILIEDDVFWISFRNTMLFVFVTGPLGYALSILLAWFINELKGVLRTFLTLLIYAPSMVGGAYFVWFFLFSPDDYGYINGFLLRWNIIKVAIQWFNDPHYNMTVLMIVQLWISMGAGFLAIIAGLKGVDRALYEAASIDGVRNRFQELWRVTLPAIMPQLLFAAILTIAGTFAVSEISINLTGFPSTEYSTSTLGVYIIDYAQVRYELGSASALAVILFALMLFFNSIIRKIFRRGLDI